MNFYTQTLIQLVLALGLAMAVGHLMAISRRGRDRREAKAALQTAPRPSRHTTTAIEKEQTKRGTATLAVAPLFRSLVFVVIGLFVALVAFVTLIR